MKFQKYLIEAKSKKKNTIIVYHGTSEKHIASIKSQGLKSNMNDPKWYMFATDFDSALFHSSGEKGKSSYVIEFEIPVTNERWDGDPYLWPAYERNPKSKWYSLKEVIPSKFIKKVHKVSYDKWSRVKSKGF